MLQGLEIFLHLGTKPKVGKLRGMHEEKITNLRHTYKYVYINQLRGCHLCIITMMARIIRVRYNFL